MCQETRLFYFVLLSYKLAFIMAEFMCVRLIEGGADVPEEMRAFKNKLDAFEFHNNQ